MIDLPPDEPREAIAAAKALLEQSRQERARACEQAIQAVLQQFHCTLDVALVLRAGELPEPSVRIVALPDAA